MKPKPWVGNEGWFDEYSQRIAILKNLNSSSVPKIKEAIKSAFMRVYRAVAFDIDGTLTENDKSAIDLRMAGLVGRLLQRGVPVFLITGRGRNSARQAADEIRKGAQLSDWYFRKLHCITHNGVFLLSTPSDDPTAFLSNWETIAPKKINKTLIAFAPFNML